MLLYFFCLPYIAFISEINSRSCQFCVCNNRELFELRKLREEGHEKDFLNVGSMVILISLIIPNHLLISAWTTFDQIGLKMRSSRVHKKYNYLQWRVVLYNNKGSCLINCARDRVAENKSSRFHSGWRWRSNNALRKFSHDCTVSTYLCIYLHKILHINISQRI